MHTPPQIKIAFIGNRNSGKSTLVNALLQGVYGHVANGTASVGIISFRVKAKPSETVSSDGNSDENNTLDDTQTLPPAISNEFIGLPSCRTLHMMYMDVRSQESMFNSYPDIEFVLTDVPGINTQDPGDIHLQYLNTFWESFDCVVVVLNAQEDVLMQLDILHIVKENLEMKRKIQILFVCNKVEDALMDCTVQKSIEQIRKLVNSIFMTSSKYLRMTIASLLLSLANCCLFKLFLCRQKMHLFSIRPEVSPCQIFRCSFSKTAYCMKD
jgi:GTPase SAR1 family protein